MNNKAQSANKSSHLVILLAVVGLVAFSSAMKDLSQLHQFAHDASDLVASWTLEASPASEIPPTRPAPPTVVKLETCEIKRTVEQSIPTIELPWLEDVAEEQEVRQIEPPQAPERVRRAKVKVVRPARLPLVDFDALQFEVRVPTDEHAAEQDATNSEFTQFSFKTRTRKPSVIRISPRDREMHLKTLNRSINLRIAS